MDSQYYLKKKNSLKKELVTTTSVFVYKLKDSLRTLKPFLYYQPFQNTEQEATIFWYRVLHSVSDTSLMQTCTPAGEGTAHLRKAAAGILSLGCEVPQ